MSRIPYGEATRLTVESQLGYRHIVEAIHLGRTRKAEVAAFLTEKGYAVSLKPPYKRPSRAKGRPRVLKASLPITVMPQRLVSRQRLHQLRFRERQRARQQVSDAVKRGALPAPRSLPCVDCGKGAEEYDHYLGYEREHFLHVQPVCIACHNKRPRNQYVDKVGR